MPRDKNNNKELKLLLERYEFDETHAAYATMLEGLSNLLDAGDFTLEDIARYLHEHDLSEAIANTGDHTITKTQSTDAINKDTIFDSIKNEGNSPHRIQRDIAPGKFESFAELMQEWLFKTQELYNPPSMEAAIPLWLQDTGLKEHLTIEDVQGLTLDKKAPSPHLGRYLVEATPTSLCYRDRTNTLIKQTRKHHPEDEQQIGLPDHVQIPYSIPYPLVSFKMLLRHWRDASNLTSDQANQKISGGKQQVKQWEHIRSPWIPLQPDTRHAVARAYGVPQSLMDWHWYRAVKSTYVDSTNKIYELSVPEKLYVIKDIKSHAEWGIKEAQLEEAFELPNHPDCSTDFGQALKGWVEIAGLSWREFESRVGIEERGREHLNGSNNWCNGKGLAVPGRLNAICKTINSAVNTQQVVANAYPFNSRSEAILVRLAEEEIKSRNPVDTHIQNRNPEPGNSLEYLRAKANMEVKDLLRAVGEKEGKILVYRQYKSWCNGHMSDESLDTICDVIYTASNGEITKQELAERRDTIAASLKRDNRVSDSQQEGRINSDPDLNKRDHHNNR